MLESLFEKEARRMEIDMKALFGASMEVEYN